MSYSFSEQFQKLERDQNVILANRYTGEWFRITKILYDALILYIECPEKINFECEDDGKAIKKFVETLCKARILYDVTQAPPKYALEPDISFAITNNCNLACTHCSYSAGKYSKDLTTDEILSIIDSLLECNPCSITITGGEPMIRKDFLEIAEYLKNSFSGTKILMTNGTLIHEQNIDVVINAFDKIDISIDGTDEKSCEEIRGKGVYNKVIKSIKLLHTKDYNDISLSMVFFEKDKLLSERFMDLCSDLKVSPLPRSFIALGRGYDNLNNIYNTVRC